MPERQRSLPGQPSLRYLKLQARRRQTSGEFPTLHDAQLAIAREHGQPSWTALKRIVTDPAGPDGPALAQLRWVIARFRDAAEPGWPAPRDEELVRHFDAGFLAQIPPDTLIRVVSSVAVALRADVVVTRQAPLAVRARVGGLDVCASVAKNPPHLLTGLRGIPLGDWVTDARAAVPPVARRSGAPPGWVAQTADAAFRELGLPGLAMAGSSPGGPAWVTVTGWADLDRGEILQPSHRFPAPGAAALVTAAAVLRLVADGRAGLDTPANKYLRGVRLADDTVTVRELLGHTGGVDSPAASALTADRVPELAAVTGPVVGCGGPRGKIAPSNGGMAVLGQLVSDIVGAPFPEAATRLVLGPLGMSESSFPAAAAEFGPRAVTGYELTTAGAFLPVPARVCTLQAAGGLWGTPADLIRLGLGWTSLLPGPLAREALTAGLGWFLTPRGDVAVNAGMLPGFASFLLLRIRDRQVHLTMTNRLVTTDGVADRVLRAWAVTNGTGIPE